MRFVDLNESIKLPWIDKYILIYPNDPFYRNLKGYEALEYALYQKNRRFRQPYTRSIELVWIYKTHILLLGKDQALSVLWKKNKKKAHFSIFQMSLFHYSIIKSNRSKFDISYIIKVA